MKLREHARQLAESHCDMLIAGRRRLGFNDPSNLSDGDALIIKRHVAADLKASGKYGNIALYWFLFRTLLLVVQEVMKRRRDTKQTWGHVGHA